jgi:hypothetical protein
MITTGNYAPVAEAPLDAEPLFIPELANIVKVEEMTALEKVFTLQLPDRRPLGNRPGQFVEVSVLGVGEAPISVSSSPSRSTETFELCVRKVGDVTAALHGLQAGDKVGIRGPFGHGFPIESFRGKDMLFAPGGLGLAPLRSLINQVLDERALFGGSSSCTGRATPASCSSRTSCSAGLSGRMSSCCSPSIAAMRAGVATWASSPRSSNLSPSIRATL